MILMVMRQSSMILIVFVMEFSMKNTKATHLLLIIPKGTTLISFLNGV